ncbi:DUF7305 domain-containing protein [Haliangium ochraceum]|uniref:Putative lipoprotein n=1 Tax=Haliangium ochraceum (strain DSM 14365 / JCM 11303 / SMP-2) TaxID=502025 RepID=D0LTX0_HALO1|nr:hypothetical protein [Haliangium ochraceum]ACY15814.1 putative lipoprotein [Haliangium ochraceum DSM 14365]
MIPRVGGRAAASALALAAALAGLAAAAQGCTQADTVAVLPGVGAIDAGPAAPACVADGALLLLDPAGAPLCTGAQAEAAFAHALCACAELTTSDAFAADAFDSASGPYDIPQASGDVAVNGDVQANGSLDVRGALTSAGAGGIRFEDRLAVDGPLRGGGVLEAAAGRVEVTGDAELAAAITLAALRVDGRLRLPESAALQVSEAPELGALERADVSVAPPCACAEAERIDVAGEVAAFAASGAHDDALLGLTPASLSDASGAVALELPCGRFLFDRIQVDDGGLTVRVAGTAALLVASDITVAGDLRIELLPGGALDLLIAGNLNVSGALNIGDVVEPARTRVYLGGVGAINLNAPGLLGAHLYAPQTDLALGGGAELFGGVFVNRLLTSGPVAIHHDTRVRRSSSACPTSP